VDQNRPIGFWTGVWPSDAGLRRLGPRHPLPPKTDLPARLSQHLLRIDRYLEPLAWALL
jgi:hypothetical protein